MNISPLRTEGPSYEDLIQLIGVFSGDKDLLNWFLSLQTMSEHVRSSHLSSMAQGMRTTHERPDLILAVESLKSPVIFDSAIKTLESLHE